jgi:DNA polymerase V|tara:strand:- start:3250 stop:3747 length:498 start_codon:yes stop_codon:yes gene_type:complete
VGISTLYQINHFLKGPLSEEEIKEQISKIIGHQKSYQAESRPQLGDASCGLFGIADDFTEDRLSLDELLIQDREATFYFKAQGDSMAPFIEEGDILIVDGSLKPRSGQIIIAFYEGQRLCKRLLFRGTMASLHSENPRYRPLPIEEESEFQVFGVVTGVIRRCGS